MRTVDATGRSRACCYWVSEFWSSECTSNVPIAFTSSYLSRLSALPTTRRRSSSHSSSWKCRNVGAATLSLSHSLGLPLRLLSVLCSFFCVSLGVDGLRPSLDCAFRSRKATKQQPIQLERRFSTQRW
jgi:hypothetical protein